MAQTWDVTLIPTDPDAPAAYVERRGAPTGEVTVRLQALDGTWEVCGADRARGVWPENVKGIRADQWGSKAASFDLRRDPKATWPDIAAFTRVQIDIDGRLRWSGRVAQTPVRDDLDSVISVQCEGMQAHLDDDLYERVYVHTKLGDWKDARSFLDVDLASYPQAATVSADGAIVLGWPKDAPVKNAAHAAVILDLGPGSLAKRIVFTYEWTNGTGNGNQYLACDAGDSADSLSDSLVSSNLGTGTTSGTARATLSTARRFLRISALSLAGSDFTATDELRLRITSCQVFAATAYESGDASVLQADDIVLDALDSATMLLSADRTLVEAGTFNIPEFAADGPRTPRQVWEAADAFEDRLKKIDLQDRAVYKAKPTAPRVEVGAWSAMSFEDASANDGSEVYSRVIVKGTQPDGTPLRVERSQAQQPGVLFDAIASPAPDNPSFASNTTGWTATGSTITRDTSIVDADSASGRWDNTGASDGLGKGDTLSTTFTGTFLAGVPYALTFRFKPTVASGRDLLVRFGAGLGDATNMASDISSTSWQTYSISWTPSANRTGVTLTLEVGTGGGSFGYLNLDSLALFAARPTIVDRRGFRRTKVLDVSFTLTTTAATRIADLWLRAHQRTPFKGTVKLTGHGAARDILTGTPLPVDALLDMTGELIRFADRIDPDTGAFGRDARIAEVSVDPDTDEATLTLDNSRAGFDALLARLDVVLGQGTR